MEGRSVGHLPTERMREVHSIPYEVTRLEWVAMPPQSSGTASAFQAHQALLALARHSYLSPVQGSLDDSEAQVRQWQRRYASSCPSPISQPRSQGYADRALRGHPQKYLALVALSDSHPRTAERSGLAFKAGTDIVGEAARLEVNNHFRDSPVLRLPLRSIGTALAGRRSKNGVL